MEMPILTWQITIPHSLSPPIQVERPSSFVSIFSVLNVSMERPPSLQESTQWKGQLVLSPASPPKQPIDKKTRVRYEVGHTARESL